MIVEVVVDGGQEDAEDATEEDPSVVAPVLKIGRLVKFWKILDELTKSVQLFHFI